MQEVLSALSTDQSLILTAPPGWGKTYKLLKGIKASGKSVVFIFPLRALCDEVYIKALELKINCSNIRKREDYEILQPKKSLLVLTTPELFEPLVDFTNVVYILDEFHLFYYWGDTFRERMSEVYMQITSYSFPVMFLTATLSEDLKDRLILELQRNYSDIYQLDFGNQQLKNFPHKTYFYPKSLFSFMEDDYKFSPKQGCSLIFCQYREQVKKLEVDLKKMGYKVLSCVGGEAKEFVQELTVTTLLDFIIATSVVSHGVNLPRIQKIYFLYDVENLDFYLQMIGRGGRQGEAFEIHTLSARYFDKIQLFKGFLGVLLKRLSNKLNFLIYMFYAS